jgi:GNAT superfamily N-acetyltransferase
MKIRRAAVTDTERVCRMHKASIRYLCQSHYAFDQIEAWAGPKRPEQYERLIRDLIVFVVEEGADVVAFGALDGAAADIKALYVAPEFVGRGIGSRVLEALESEARHLRIPRLSVSATLNSVGFYSARGYMSVGAAENVLPQGTTLPCVSMEKTLAV